MKVFKADYDWRGGHGAFETKQYVIIAETKATALGLILEEEDTTYSDQWTIEEINTSYAGTHYVSSRCN